MSIIEIFLLIGLVFLGTFAFVAIMWGIVYVAMFFTAIPYIVFSRAFSLEKEDFTYTGLSEKIGGFGRARKRFKGIRLEKTDFALINLSEKFMEYWQAWRIFLRSLRPEQWVFLVVAWFIYHFLI